MLPDGSIPQVEITSQGLAGEPLPTNEVYNSGICCNLISDQGAVHIDVDREAERSQVPYVYEDGDGYVENISNGTNVGFKYFAFTGQESQMKLLVRGNAKGTLKVCVDGGSKEWLTGVCGQEIGVAEVELQACPRETKPSVQWQAAASSPAQWQEVTVALRKTEGCHSLYVIFEGEGSLAWRSFTFV